VQLAVDRLLAAFGRAQQRQHDLESDLRHRGRI
jgi:hypothetical protein